MGTTKTAVIKINGKAIASDYAGYNSYANAGGTDYSGYGTATASVIDSLNNLIKGNPKNQPAPTYTPPPAPPAEEGMSIGAKFGIGLAIAAGVGLIGLIIYKAVK